MSYDRPSVWVHHKIRSLVRVNEPPLDKIGMYDEYVPKTSSQEEDMTNINPADLGDRISVLEALVDSLKDDLEQCQAAKEEADIVIAALNREVKAERVRSNAYFQALLGLVNVAAPSITTPTPGEQIDATLRDLNLEEED